MHVSNFNRLKNIAYKLLTILCAAPWQLYASSYKKKSVKYVTRLPDVTKKIWFGA